MAESTFYRTVDADVVVFDMTKTATKYTPEQIGEHCKKVASVCSSCGDGWHYWDMVLESLQIIRQLQEEKQDLRDQLSDYQVEFGDLQT